MMRCEDRDVDAIRSSLLRKARRMPWFALRLEPRRERVALTFLHLAGHAVYAPQTAVERIVCGRPVQYRRLLFPAYCFTSAVAQWGALRGLPGVVGPVGCNGCGPSIVDDRVIAAIREREGADGLIHLVAPKINGRRWRRGDRLRIGAGAFEGRDAIFEGEAPRERIRVLLDLMGATWPIELPADHIAQARSSTEATT